MIALLVLFGVLPTGPAVVDQVDLIEVNHYYDPQGRLIFNQVIFYEWSQASACFHVRAWRLLKSPWQVPRRDWQSGGYVSPWIDGGTPRRVTAANVRETWTHYDPELIERNYLPREFRRDLSSRDIPLILE